MNLRIYKIIALLLLTCTASISVAMHKNTKKNTKNKSVKTISSPIQALEFGRSGCFGTCPIYYVELFKDGKMVYHGKRYTDYIGDYEKQISDTSMLNFFNRFYAIKPDTLEDSYTIRVADLPGFYFKITYKNATKQVLNAENGPRFLRDWARKIDDFVNIDKDWKQLKDLDKNH